MKAAKVTWRDANSSTSWTTVEDAEKHRCVTVYTVGWLMEGNNYDDNVIVALSWDVDNKTVADYIAIPRGCIEKIEVMTAGETY